MKNNYFLKFTIVVFILSMTGYVVSAQSSSASFWTKTNTENLQAANRSWYPNQYVTFSLQNEALKSFLSGAPMETSAGPRTSSFTIDLPMPDGNFNRYKVVESPVMDAALGVAYPFIKTYSGQGLDDKTATIRFDVTQFGFHAYILSANGTVYIDPLEFRNTGDYIVYYKRDIPVGLYRFSCESPVDEEKTELNSNENRIYQPTSSQSIGNTLRTYRLALAADFEYVTYYGGTRAGALAGMVTTMNRVNGVYERELCVRLVLVPNDTLLIYTTSTDPYTNSSGSAMLTQNQNTCSSLIGSANYDMGHVFSTGGGGIASRGCICSATTKARGVTGLPDPIGDAFDIDFVVHEMGHQFGGNHTFNSTTGNCGGTTRASTAAYEPGSASTIMGYAGICDVNDLQLHSDDYFHTKSFDEIITYSQTGTGNTCAVQTSTGNNAPTITIPSTTFTIPFNTPFQLTATGTDPDGDPITFCWEEYDLGPACNWNAPTGNAPIFRSFSPVVSPTRLFPALPNILNNTLSIGEIKASYTRSLSFRCTARDNQANGGGVTHSPSTVTLNVDATGGVPFAITAPNTTGIVWAAGSTQTVTWNVGNSNVAPINTPNVNIYLSVTGGLDFPILIAASVSNNGSYSFTVPNNPTAQGRIMVEGDGNVFFDINDKSFTITGPVGILENTLSNYINIYPNPAKDDVHVVINNPSAGNCKITLNDLAGRMVKEINARKNSSFLDQVLDLSGISKGLYIVRFEMPEGVAEKKLVKE